jgi:hypothetical protein
MSPRTTAGIGPVVSNENETLVPGNLDFFNGSTYASGVERFFSQICHPVTTLTNEGPYEFRILSAQNECVLPSFIKVGGKIKIVQTDGTNLSAADTTSVVNLPFDSLFSYITVELENTKLEDTSYCYPYKAMIEKGLSYSGAAKRTHMRSALFEADTPGKFDVLLVGGGNKGFDARKKRFAASKFAHFHFPLALDLSTLSKPLPPSTSLKLIFHRSSDHFTLMGASTHKIEIEQLYLEIGKIVLSDSVANSVARKFTTTPFNYDITHTKITKFTIPTGLYDGSKYAVFNKVALPRFVMIALVRQVIFYYAEC